MSAIEETSDLELDTERLAAWLGEQRDLQLVDVRELHEREAGHIAGSRHVELVKLTSQAESFQRERPLVFYCRVGSRSEMAAQAFRAAGYEAYTLRGGILRWAREERALEPDGGYVAEH